MKPIIISIFIAITITIFSCNYETIDNPKINNLLKVDNKEEILDSLVINKEPKNKPIPLVDRIIFYNVMDSTFHTESYIPQAKILDTALIPELLNIFYRNLEPTYHGGGGQSAGFILFQGKEHIKTFLVDKSFGTYYLVEHMHQVKKLDSIKLVSLLSGVKDVNAYYLGFENVKDARDALNYAYSNDLSVTHPLPSITEWIEFDGEFVFSYSCLKQNKNNDSIFYLMQSTFGENNIEITYPQNIMSQDSVKLSYRVYSNEDIYNRFIVEFQSFDYISNFMKFKPEFQLFATKSEYERLKKANKG